ncbi:hypothetical protein M8818_001876 [Zalaria obscura]|uniref:Uncharacterized protein n=1 Tax=Zalaria obscura TaxID=2024903 RepID=A0ACC3SK61_9PEZI
MIGRYINSYYTILGLQNRFTNLRDMHELYCLGHLAEAAAAHHLLTGSKDLIAVVRRMVDLVRKIVVPKGGYPGHQELEIGLLRLYDITKERVFLESAEYFIRERGTRDAKDEIYFDREAFARGVDPYEHLGTEYKAWFRKPRDYAYMQAHTPLAEQTTIEGHSVRAMYYLTAAQHYTLVSGTESKDIEDAVVRLFENTVRKKMYVTGGIGSVTQCEGFGPEYHLPDLNEGGGCYSETCASFALIILCERMLRAELKGLYGDVMERALLNCVLGAVGMQGKSSIPAAFVQGLQTIGDSFYYENHLATRSGHPHERSKWFDVACCPPNIAKLIGLLPTLTYSVEGKTCAIHLFIGSSFTAQVDGQDVVINMQTDYPWQGTVTIAVQTSTPMVLAIRIPSWAANSYTSSTQGNIRNGYLHTEISSSTTLTFDFPMAPRLVYSHPALRKDEVAVMRGPLVYCAESVDNDFDLERTYIISSHVDEVKEIEIAGVQNVPLVKVGGRVRSRDGFGENGEELYGEERPGWEDGEREVLLVPYFLRMNRDGCGGMRVWLKDS